MKDQQRGGSGVEYQRKCLARESRVLFALQHENVLRLICTCYDYVRTYAACVLDGLLTCLIVCNFRANTCLCKNTVHVFHVEFSSVFDFPVTLTDVVRRSSLAALAFFSPLSPSRACRQDLMLLSVPFVSASVLLFHVCLRA